jgi:hypothetical protein
MKNYKATVIEKKSMENMAWDVMINRLEAKKDVRNIKLDKEKDKLTYEVVTELLFEAESLDDAQKITKRKTAILVGVASFNIFIEEIQSLSEEQEVEKVRQNPVPEKFVLNQSDAENYLYEMDMTRSDSITLKEGFNNKTIITRDDVINALPHLKN